MSNKTRNRTLKVADYAALAAQAVPAWIYGRGDGWMAEWNANDMPQK